MPLFSFTKKKAHRFVTSLSRIAHGLWLWRSPHRLCNSRVTVPTGHMRHIDRIDPRVKALRTHDLDEVT